MRRRSRTTRYLGEREAGQRVALDNAARSQKTEPHNRRKPGIGSVGDEEVGGRLGSGSVPILEDHDGNLNKGRISAEGRWPARELNIPGLTDNPDSDAGRAVDAKSFADRNRDVNDALGARATNAEVKNALDVAQAKTTVKQVDARIRKLVKKNSLNRG